MSRYKSFTILVLMGTTLLHLWYIGAGLTNLAPDEAHYWDWSRRLDWSYYSKPPLVAYLIAASTHLVANTEFGVRLPAIFLGLVTGVLLYLISRTIFASERAAFLTVVLFVAVPLHSAGSMLMTIDAPLIFFWALGLFSLWKAIHTVPSSMSSAWGHRRWWVLLGIALGLGLLSKYAMGFFLLCLGCYLLTSAVAHPFLTRPHPYVAILFAILMFAPVLVWNAHHDWVSLRHVAGQAGLSKDTIELSTKTFFNFLASQFGVISPFLFLLALAAIVRSGLAGFRDKRDEHLYLFLFSAPLLCLFLIWSLFTKVQGNWTAPAYVSAVVSLGRWFDELLQEARVSERGKRWAQVFTFSVLSGFLVVTAGHFPSLLPLMGIHLPPNLDPTSRLQGWRELGDTTGAIIEASGRKDLFIMSDRYQLTSELAFYTPGQPEAYSINLGRRLNQYDIWGGLDALRGRDGLFVTDWTVDAPEQMRQACESIERIRVFHTYLRGPPNKTFSIFFCKNFNVPRQVPGEPQY